MRLLHFYGSLLPNYNMAINAFRGKLYPYISGEFLLQGRELYNTEKFAFHTDAYDICLFICG